MSLKKLIKNLKSRSAPKKKCKKALWQQLDHGFDRMYPAALPRLISKPAAVALCAVLVILGVGTGAYAYDSPAVVEGHPLYAMKNALEKFEGKLRFTPEQKAAWHIKMQQRRLEEGEFLASERNELREKIFEKGILEMGQGLEQMKRIESQDIRRKMFRRVGEIELAQFEVLQKIKPELSPYSQQMIDRIIAEQTRRINEQIQELGQAEREVFGPVGRRRFIIITSNALPAEINSSSEAVITPEMIPVDDPNMQIRLISY